MVNHAKFMERLKFKHLIDDGYDKSDMNLNSEKGAFESHS